MTALESPELVGAVQEEPFVERGRAEDCAGAPADGKPRRKRILGLSRGDIEVSDDFDDPLPDSFWFGEE